MLGTLGHRARTAARPLTSRAKAPRQAFCWSSRLWLRSPSRALRSGPAFEALSRQELGLSLGDGPFGGRSFIGSTTGSGCARALGCATSHRLCQPRWQAARRGRLRGSDGRVPEQAQPGRDHETPGRCLRPEDPGGDARELPPRPERQIIGDLAKDFSRRPLEDIASLIADAPLETAACASPSSHNPRE